MQARADETVSRLRDLDDPSPHATRQDVATQSTHANTLRRELAYAVETKNPEARAGRRAPPDLRRSFPRAPHKPPEPPDGTGSTARSRRTVRAPRPHPFVSQHRLQQPRRSARLRPCCPTRLRTTSTPPSSPKSSRRPAPCYANRGPARRRSARAPSAFATGRECSTKMKSPPDLDVLSACGVADRASGRLPTLALGSREDGVARLDSQPERDAPPSTQWPRSDAAADSSQIRTS